MPRGRTIRVGVEHHRVPPLPPDDGALNGQGRLSRELVGLIKAVAAAEAEREERLNRKVHELDDRLAEVERIRTLVAGGAARREARMRALEKMVESLAAERQRPATPRPLDLPKRSRYDPSVVDMRSPDRD
jgi:hypothetical protein